MKTRTIFLLILSSAILAFLYYFDRKRLVDRWAAEVQKTRLLPFPADKADGIVVENRFGRFELARRRDGWWITNPVTELADQNTVTGVLFAALSESSKFGAVPATEEERAQYGLKEGAVRIRVASTEEGKTAELAVGAATPIAGEHYLADAAQPLQVYATQSNLRKAFDRPVLDLRDKRVLGFDASEVVRVSTTWEENRLVFTRGENRGWTITGPSDAASHRADPHMVQQLLGLVEKTLPLSFDEEAKLDPGVVRRAFMDVSGEPGASSAEPGPSPEEAAEVSRERARHQVILETGRKTQATSETQAAHPPAATPDQESGGLTRLIFHPRLADFSTSVSSTLRLEKKWLLTVDNRKLLFDPPSGLVKLLQEPARDFYDRTVFSFDADEVCYLQIEWKIGPVSSVLSLERKKDGPWRSPARPGAGVNQDNATLYVSYCLGQMVEPELPPTTSTLAAGFEEPLLRVTLADADRSRREGFELGNLVSKTSPFYYARRIGPQAEDAGKIFSMRLVPSLNVFIKSENDFAEQPVLLFDPKDVDRVVLYFRADKATSATLRRAGQGSDAWRGAWDDREPKTLPGPAVETFLLTLRGLQYSSEVEPVRDALLEEYGLKRPALSIHLYDRAGSELNALHLGVSTEEKRETTVIRNGRNRFYRVSVGTLRNMGQALGGILARMQ